MKSNARRCSRPRRWSGHPVLGRGWPGHVRARFGWIALAVSFVAAGCGGSDPGSGDEVEPGSFLAFETSFRGFRGWESFVAENSDEIPASPHLTGERTAYLSQRPPSGSTSFPVGTIIVKEIINGDPATSDVVARVKRGGTYNSRGATGWEWFELLGTPSGAAILWRGVGPPAGETYLGNVEGGCNACHGGGDDVSILMPALRLSNF